MDDDILWAMLTVPGASDTEKVWAIRGALRLGIGSDAGMDKETALLLLGHEFEECCPGVDHCKHCSSREKDH